VGRKTRICIVQDGQSCFVEFRPFLDDTRQSFPPTSTIPRSLVVNVHWLKMIEIYLALFATITHAATITRRAVIPRAESTSFPPELIGYAISQDSTETWNCRESSAWQTVGTVGKCCMTDGSDCFMATTCISGSIMANGQARSTWYVLSGLHPTNDGSDQRDGQVPAREINLKVRIRWLTGRVVLAQQHRRHV
jgi:hypothetical protein